MQKSIFTLTLLFFTFTCSWATPKKALFIGNSYTYYNNMPELTRSCGLSVLDSLEVDQSTIGGHSFTKHASETSTLNKIKSGSYDYIILQGQSLEFTRDQQTIDTKTIPNATFLDSLAHTHNPCVQIIYYNTWGRKNGLNGQTYLQQDTMIENGYLQLATDNKAMVSPVGPVRRLLRQTHPEIELYTGDESHPSLAGSYTSALCFYCTIFRKDPTLVTFNSSLNSSDADAIKNAVKEILFNNLTDWNIGLFDFKNPNVDFDIELNNNEVNFTNQTTDALTYEWNFGDNLTSTETNPKHNYESTGNYLITLTAINCGVSKQLTQLVNIVTTSLYEIQPTYEVYPNPSQGIINLRFNNADLKNIILTDINGVAIFNTTTNETSYKIDEFFSNGLYILTIRTEILNESKPIIIQH